ncbi:MAG: HAD-IIIA family hydrolase [Ruminococcus sp.]|nr:HAD-IIIA family hydrolase [Ruminococcus sp.]
MLKKYYPWGYARSVFSLDYRKLYAKGFRAVIFDLDNTLVHHGDPSTPEVDALFREIHAAGLKTLLLTNNDEERVQMFIKNIDTLYICDADKPSPECYEKALAMLGTDRRETLCVGDQIFIDVIGANRAGIPSLLVHYIQLPGETKIGKKRYIEKLILSFYRRDSRLRNRLGDVYRKGVN